MRFKIIIITLIAILTFSCELKDAYDDTLTGDGNIVESSIPIKDSNNIYLFYSYNYSYDYSDGSSYGLKTNGKRAKVNIIKSNENRVEIVTDKNILDNIDLTNREGIFDLSFLHDYYTYDFTQFEITFYIPKLENIENGIKDSDVYISGFDVIEKLSYTCSFGSNLYLPETFTVNSVFYINIQDGQYNGDFNLYGVKNLIVGDRFRFFVQNHYMKTSSKIQYPDLQYIKSKYIDINLSNINENLLIEADNAILMNSHYDEIVNINTINTNNKLELIGSISCNSISSKTIRLDEVASTKVAIATESIEVNNLTSIIDKIESPIVKVNSAGSFQIKEIITDQLNLNLGIGYNNDNTAILPSLTNINTVNIVLEGYDLDLSGSVNNLNVSMPDLYSSSTLNCSKLVAKNVYVHLNNDNKAHVNVTEELIYNLNGSSKLTYQGTKNINESSTKEESSTLIYIGE